MESYLQQLLKTYGTANGQSSKPKPAQAAPVAPAQAKPAINAQAQALYQELLKRAAAVGQTAQPFTSIYQTIADKLNSLVR